ncbi:hypothetical protein [Verrucomicrobium sp. GAS474]|uniref:hypothetical protein n=1 Tax=Verrucomicrobium sp. GAS474 TaxID=1882831 RepID=UPI0013900BDD|nr:hypothetical protein [Verrucomicrobium sp. GAS474]
MTFSHFMVFCPLVLISCFVLIWILSKSRRMNSPKMDLGGRRFPLHDLPTWEDFEKYVINHTEYGKNSDGGQIDPIQNPMMIGLFLTTEEKGVFEAPCITLLRVIATKEYKEHVSSVLGGLEKYDLLIYGLGKVGKETALQLLPFVSEDIKNNLLPKPMRPSPFVSRREQNDEVPGDYYLLALGYPLA